MEAAVIVFWILVVVLSLVAVLAVIGLIMSKRKAAKAKAEDVLPEKTVENVLDLNDRFNRARYMDRDGE